ncbi:MAG TPA: glycoside hydrolase family 3 N-terminal domain-containing protein [Jatrophihabitans sp.]|nr:glycoside hydrolase family 3 N-terminal domain-containing protein [Jatrophihabitans sp.]
MTSDDAIEARVDQLLAVMTPAQKAGQLSQYMWADALTAADDEADGGLGDTMTPAQQRAQVEAALARGEVGSLLFVTDPEETNRLQRLALDGNPHGVPLLFGYDVIHGLRTIFPVPIAMAASWDPAIVERAQAVAAREARAVGIHWTFAPMVDIARDPRWGRIVEGAGEDAVLGAAIGAAQVRGFQGERWDDPERVIAGPKHFAGYGAAVGGRDYDEVELSDHRLWNVYLPPFRAAIEAGAGNVMTAYMDLNGIPATGNRWLFTEVLRETFGFDGFVVSDFNAVRNLVTHGFAADLRDAGVRALSAGTDMEMAMADPAFATLPDSLAAGDVDLDVLDRAARRVLLAKARAGLLDDPFVDVERSREVLADPAHREVAREAAERAAVLLRNEGSLLPLDPAALSRVAVLGPLAESRRDLLGPWCFDYDLDETPTLAEGLRARLGNAVVDSAWGVRPVVRPTPSLFDAHGGNKPIVPADFDDDAEFARAIELATAADVAVVVLGEWQNMIGEQASRSSLELPGRQLELLQAVVATGTPVVLCLVNGRPVDLRWAAENVPAIIELWYPGTQGAAAAARLLVGDVSPGGKLPLTWPRSVGQVPIVYSHTISHDPANQAARYWDEPSTPLFPFGHGLSYTRFAYGVVTLDRDSIGPDDTATVSVTVTNTGDHAADEVVQLYVHQRHGAASRPIRELKGFCRVTLEPGAAETVTFPLGRDQLTYWNAATRGWVLDATVVDIAVGGDSTAPFTAAVTVTAERAS